MLTDEKSEIKQEDSIMKKILAIVLALVFVLSMAAFAEGNKTTVTIWHTFTKDQEAYLVKAANDFNASQN